MFNAGAWLGFIFHTKLIERERAMNKKMEQCHTAHPCTCNWYRHERSIFLQKMLVNRIWHLMTLPPAAFACFARRTRLPRHYDNQLVTLWFNFKPDGFLKLGSYQLQPIPFFGQPALHATPLPAVVFWSCHDSITSWASLMAEATQGCSDWCPSPKLLMILGWLRHIGNSQLVASCVLRIQVLHGWRYVSLGFREWYIMLE